MNNILKTLIDYSLFEKYDKEYFIKNKIVPICEDNISLKVAICNSSNLSLPVLFFHLDLLTFEPCDYFSARSKAIMISPSWHSLGGGKVRSSSR